MSRDFETPVLIVGGGGAGLTASMLLSQLGVESHLVSALPTTSILPKAHVLNQRTMEILSDVGVADEIYARGTPRANMRATAWYAGLAGPHRDYGRQVGRMEAWGGGYEDPDWVAASPRASTNLPQIRLEPILKRRAEALAPGRVHFHHEVVGVEQDGELVTATVVDRDTAREYRVRSRYLLACDGGRAIGKMTGVEMEGERALMNEISIHMTADLSSWARDPEVLIRWLILPTTGALAVLVPMGPTRWGPDSEEWVFHLNYPSDDPRSLDDAVIEADMRAGLGIGDHPVEIHKISRWSLEGVVASRFQVGRVFLLGDAAHRHPPTGGLGLTSAIQDAHNLCWKVAAVLAGRAGETLLGTYEAERRPVVSRNVRRSVENAFNQMAIVQALELVSGDAGEVNLARVGRLWSGKPEDREFRKAVRAIVASQSMEFREHNVEYGYTYNSEAVVPDGSPEPDHLDDIRIYQPSTRPGSPLPHAWIEDDDYRRSALMELVVPGHFLLIAGEDGESWCEAARSLAAEHDLPLDAITLGHCSGDYLDPRCHWLQRREIRADGAILVRPDRFVAWRSMGASEDPTGSLRAALTRVLATPLAVAGGIP